MSASVTASASAAAGSGGGVAAEAPADPSAGRGGLGGGEPGEGISVGDPGTEGVPAPIPRGFFCEGSCSPVMSSSASTFASSETMGSGAGGRLSASFDTSRLATHSSRSVDA
eukprot:1638427-Amphidinium_carterae.1